jgi:uncharacterized phage-associated protein
MKTIDQILKIEAVVLYVLQAFKEGVDYIKLYKILYFAQREYLGNYGLCLCLIALEQETMVLCRP